MKKIFFIIIAVIVIILFFNMYGTFAYQSNQSKPYIDFKKKIDISQLFDYRDPTYGYTISYPDFFEHEDTSLSNYQSYARFSYTDRTNVVLESYVTKNHCTSLQTCADSLATKLHATKTMNRDSSFLLAGPVYENGVRMKGYSH